MQTNETIIHELISHNNYGLIDYGVNLYVQNCSIFPPLINSAGLWDNGPHVHRILTGSLQVLELQIITVFALTHLIHVVLRIQGTPIFASQLLAGLILGPTTVGEVEKVKSFFFPDKTSLQVFDTLGMFGIVLFMFLVGVKTDIRLVSMAGKMGIAIAILTRVLLLVATNLMLLSLKNEDVYYIISDSTEAWDVIWKEHMAFCFSQGPAPLGFIVYLLSELRMLNSKLGRLAVSWALVGHFGDMLVSISSSFNLSPKKGFAVVLFVLFMFFFMRPLMHWLVMHKDELPVLQETIMPLTLLLVFTFAYCTPFFEIGPTFAAFLFGLIVPQGPPLGSVLELKVEPFVTGILLPLFTASTTMRFSLWDLLLQSERAERAIRVGLTCFIIKLLSTFLPSLFFIKLHWKEALVISLILSSKGFTELFYYIKFKDRKAIFGGVYAAGVVGVLLNSSLLPIAIKSLYASICEKEVQVKRSIMNLMKENSPELKILVCVHGLNDVASILSFVKATHPTKHNQLDLYLLHLKQMTGSHSSIFLVHDRKETKSGFIMGFFEDVILPFYQLEQEFSGLVTMKAYTAISPPKDMDEDIFNLAMNNQTSLVILPFHRKWYSGSCLVESESSAVRNLNCSVFNRVSCSVGVFIHRPNYTREKLQDTLTCFDMCMIFFGGKDDREALALSKRIVKHPSVSLDIIRFIPNEELVVSMDWDKVLDVEALKEFRMNKISDDDDQRNHNVSYRERKVNDGPETTLLIRKFVNKYDLIVVGRRYGLECTQTSGLSDLVEFPELGIIGDFLACTDADCCKTSILIVQQ